MRDTSEIHDVIHVSQMYLESYVSELQDTCLIHALYMPYTCGIHVTSEVIKIHAGYMRDSFGVHAGYMRDTYLGGLGEK